MNDPFFGFLFFALCHGSLSLIGATTAQIPDRVVNVAYSAMHMMCLILYMATIAFRSRVWIRKARVNNFDVMSPAICTVAMIGNNMGSNASDSSIVYIFASCVLFGLAVLVAQHEAALHRRSMLMLGAGVLMFVCVQPMYTYGIDDLWCFAFLYATNIVIWSTRPRWYSFWVFCNTNALLLTFQSIFAVTYLSSYV